MKKPKKISEKKDFYSALADEYIAKLNQLLSFPEHSIVKGGCTESLIRDLVRRNVPEKYTVSHGVLFKNQITQISSQCDVIVHEPNSNTCFGPQGLAIVDSESVKLVIEVKSTLNSEQLKTSFSTFKRIKEFNEYILCGIIGIKSETLLKTLCFNGWKSKNTEFIHYFKQEKLKTENEVWLKNQMKYFINFLNFYVNKDSSLLSRTDNFVIRSRKRLDSNSKSIFFPKNINENHVKKELSKLYSSRNEHNLF